MLARAVYRYKGFALDTESCSGAIHRVPLYDPIHYKKMYEMHISFSQVKKYFQNRPQDLLILNVAESDSYMKLGSFFGLEIPKRAVFPWLNKT